MHFQRFVAGFGLSSVCCAVLAAPSRAQCLDWKDSFPFSSAGVTYPVGYYPLVNAVLPWDDGTGLSLYVAGFFSVAGDIPATHIARWNGSDWSALPAPPHPFEVMAMAAFDDGSGPALYVGGKEYSSGFSSILRWDGASWSTPGSGVTNSVYALAVVDLGSGPALYAAGDFGMAGGAPASMIAKWDGSTWSPLGSGMQGQWEYGDLFPRVSCLAGFDDGNGPALYAGGFFTSAGGTPVHKIAKWDGSSWSDVGGGMTGTLNTQVRALAVFDDGAGARLYAGGYFNYAGGVVSLSMAKWDGSAWSAVGSGLTINSTVTGLAVSDQGGTPALYAVGNIRSTTPFENSLAKWDGTDWTRLGAELRKPSYDPYDPGEAPCVASFDDGSGTAVYVGGDFLFDGTNALHSIARWDGGSWSRVGPPTGRGTSNSVHCLSLLDLGAGSRLYAGGEFNDAGGIGCQGVALWTGTNWAPLGDGIVIPAPYFHVEALAAVGSTLYAGGAFLEPGRHIARWNGSTWGPVGTGQGELDGYVHALVSHDDGSGPALYAGGDFVYAWPTILGKLAKWDGSSWSNLGGMTDRVRTLASFDDGGGLALFAGGDFDYAGPTAANRIAKRIGNTWYPLGSGTDAPVHAMCAFDDGTGPALYVGGQFTTAGGVAANRIAKWNGATWSALGAGFDGTVLKLAVHDDGNGPALYAGGEFTHSGSFVVPHLARWNGSTWKPMGSGTNDVVRALASCDDGDGNGPSLWVGGDFTATASIPSSHIGVWRGCPDTVSAMCYGDGTVAPCPCANQGVFRHGCENSAHTGGARLYATGATIPDSLVLHAVGELPTALTIFLQGNALIYESAAFGDGLRCAGGALKRMYVKSASGGIAVAPQGGDPSITVRSGALGDPIPSGGTRYYQTYYRDSNPSFCPVPQGSTFNSTNGLRVVW